mgnify:CR=1 FL=1|tara:strand:- start:523 stop:852 length:330 start_codon:yes stop_codon:yes gene_type:complete
MGEKGEQEWQTMWGAEVKVINPGNLMPDDLLKSCITTTQKYLAEFPDFEKDGLQVAELIKKHLDTTWSPSWHVIIGKNFGSLCTHETKRFLYFYTGDKAVMIFKAGGAP